MIREYKQEDFNYILKYAKEFESEVGKHLFCGGIEEESFLANMKKYLELGILKIWVTEKDEIVTGGIGFLKTPNYVSNAITLSEMFWFVSKEHRGSLENLRLIKFMEKYAKENGIEYLIMFHMNNEYGNKLTNYYIKNNFKLAETKFIKKVI